MNGSAEPWPPSAQCAAASDASFLSIAHVGDLLRHARDVERTCSMLALPLTQSREGLSVLSRVQREARFEELWSPDSALPNSDAQAHALAQASPLMLLRAGVLRALGAPPPPSGACDASVALSRDIVSAPGEVSLRYCTAAQDDLRADALAEWCEDLLFFSAWRGFTAAQARCVLLAAMHVMDAIASLPSDAGDEVAARCCAASLAAVLIEHSCIDPEPQLPRSGTSRPIPAPLQGTPTEAPGASRAEASGASRAEASGASRAEASGASRAEASGASRAEASGASRAEASGASRAEASGASRAEASGASRAEASGASRAEASGASRAPPGAGLCFSTAEVAEVLERVAEPALRHWRLLRTVLSQPQPVTVRSLRVVQTDIYPFCVPPLAQFLREDVQALETQRVALAAQAEAAVAEDFEALFAAPLREMEEERDRLRMEWEAQERLAEENNRLDALGGEQYGRVVRALALRLAPLVERNTGLAKKQEQEQSTVITSPQPTPILQTQQQNSAKKKSAAQLLSTRSRTPVNMEAPLSPLLPPVEAVFSLDAVERRVTKLEAAAQALAAAAKVRPSKRR